jgi:hypothetical protein
VKTKFDSLFEQTFISAQQKQPSVPADKIDAVQPNDGLKDDTMSVVAAMPAAVSTNVPGNMDDEREEDSMVKANLFSLFSDAKEIHEIIQGGFHPEAWVIQKIAICSDNLSSVLKSVKYESTASACGCGSSEMPPV